MRLWPWRRKRWSAVIVGLESGRETELGFIHFRDRVEADAWVARMNARTDVANPLTRYEVRSL